MKYKKLLALVLVLALGCGMLVSAGAADTVDRSEQELLNVTAKVKATLDLDTEAFTDFQGWPNEDVLLGKRWTLNWTGDGESLSITADEKGKIYSYSHSVTSPDQPEDIFYRSRGLTIPSLPVDQSADALKAAQDFLNKVLEPGVETATLTDNSIPSLSRSAYRYYGTVLLNGLESPITCNLTVQPGTLHVSRFWRSDEYSGYMGGVPSADTKVSDAQVRRTFRETVELDARYVLSQDGKTANVLYVRMPADDYYVDGATGKLINLTELRSKLSRGGGDLYNKFFDASMSTMEAPEAAADEAGGVKLTQAEQDGAAKLAGALSKEQLDTVIQNAWPELGLNKYSLAASSYSVSEVKDEDGNVTDYNITARLTYGKQQGEVTFNKYVTVDAKTGELQSLYSRRYAIDGSNPSCSYTPNQVKGKVEKFLTSFLGEDRMAELKLSDTADGRDSKGWQHTFTYTQNAYGYFYYGNYYSVSVDATDGTIASFYASFDEDVELVNPGLNVVGKIAALDTYMASVEVNYCYLSVPTSVNLAAPRELWPLLQQNGYQYVSALKNGFVLNPWKLTGIDVVTGKPVMWQETEISENKMAYDDLEGSWVKNIAEELAVFRVGFYGGSLQPTKLLTQLDMVALLASVDGYTFDPTDPTKEEIDWLYNTGYALGLVTPATRDEEKILTRGELVKFILDAAGYEKIAKLSNIFRCDFSDADTIEDMGYAALAQGLGLVKGDSTGAYAGGREITRAEAVAMLYQYMK